MNKLTESQWEQDFNLLYNMKQPPYRTLLYGPCGTGKTNRALSAFTGQNEKITLTQGMFPDALNGKFLLKNGSTDWIYAPASRAGKNGCVLVLDELAKAGIELDSTLNAYMDDPTIARIELENGETITPAAGYRVIATMNGTPDQLGESVLDRFDIILRAGTPAAGLLQRLRPDVAAFTQNWYANQPDTDNFKRKMGTRAMLAFCNLTSKEIQGTTALDDETAARLIFGDNEGEAILIGIMDAARNIEEKKARR